MISREPEWTDHERGRALALQYIEDTNCGNCGNDLAVTLEKDAVYDVDHNIVCGACRAKDIVVRDLQKKHENDKPVEGIASYFDGRIVSVRPMSQPEIDAYMERELEKQLRQQARWEEGGTGWPTGR